MSRVDPERRVDQPGEGKQLQHRLCPVGKVGQRHDHPGADPGSQRQDRVPAGGAERPQHDGLAQQGDRHAREHAQRDGGRESDRGAGSRRWAERPRPGADQRQHHRREQQQRHGAQRRPADPPANDADRPVGVQVERTEELVGDRPGADPIGCQRVDVHREQPEHRLSQPHVGRKMDGREVARRRIAPVEAVEDHEAQQPPEELRGHGGQRGRAVLQDRAQAHGGQRGVARRSRIDSHRLSRGGGTVRR